MQQIIQARQQQTGAGASYTTSVAAQLAKLAISRNKNAAATIVTTAIAVTKGNSVVVDEKTGQIVVTVVAVAANTAPDQSGAVTTAAASLAPELLAAITNAAVQGAPDRAADITAAAVKNNPSQAAAVAQAAARAAPQQAAAITTAAVAAAPSQAANITTQVSTVQGVNSQDVQTAANTTTPDSVDTTNDGFDDVEPVATSAAQDNEASPTTPKS
ncbi:hypothetical protein CSC3H3_14340 [Thalassospira marina]|uniref:Uncharacterized protein n=1 Tax=Thalassospira marina TaxID=2048283 RepID=A0A2N3KWL8_9PROT|nr:hypothetical protein CSC3H3_14340 [Thalassospira marina]PKR54907.1 hypothetical protein COO20_05780 [Thalassospira marina]